MKTEKHYYKLADYFVTIGLDNYYVPEEIYRNEEKQRESVAGGPDGMSMTTTDVNSNEFTTPNPTATIDQQRQSLNKELRNQVEDFKIIEDDESGLQWNKIVKSLEILVIQDESIFE